MTTINLSDMRKAGQSSSISIDASVAILKGITDEATISALRYEFIVGRVMSNKLSDNQAIDYLPAADAKPMQKGKWLPFLIDAPDTFDAAKHRPLDVHNRYRAALTAWSQVRKDEDDKPKVTPSGLAVEMGLDTAAIVAHVTAFDSWLERTLKTNAKAVRGEAGSRLNILMGEMHMAVSAIRKALEDDTVSAPAPKRASANEARMAETMETMQRELEALSSTKLAKAA